MTTACRHPPMSGSGKAQVGGMTDVMRWHPVARSKTSTRCRIGFEVMLCAFRRRLSSSKHSMERESPVFQHHLERNHQLRLFSLPISGQVARMRSPPSQPSKVPMHRLAPLFLVCAHPANAAAQAQSRQVSGHVQVTSCHNRLKPSASSDKPHEAIFFDTDTRMQATPNVTRLRKAHPPSRQEAV